MNKIVFLLLSMLMISGCMLRIIDKDVSSDPKYSKFIGRELRTKKEFVIKKYSKNYKETALYEPFILGELEGLRGKKFPLKVPSARIGDFVITNDIILGILPIGSKLKIFEVRHHETFEDLFIQFYVEVIESSAKELVGVKGHCFEIYPEFDPNSANSDPKCYSKDRLEFLPVSESSSTVNMQELLK